MNRSISVGHTVIQLYYGIFDVRITRIHAQHCTKSRLFDVIIYNALMFNNEIVMKINAQSTVVPKDVIS